MLSLPGTQQPYAYALNNPLRYTDPSGEFVGALLGGLAIGAVAGGVSYALQHGGQPLACFMQDPDFWRAVAIGGVSGTVSGFVAGFFAPLWLLSSGVGTAMQIGGFIGMLSAFSGHVVSNVLNGRPAAEGVGWAMLSGAVFGALGGALGYMAQQARLKLTTQPGTGTNSPNPYGKLGGPEHRAVVDQIKANVRSQGLMPKTEFRVLTPGGHKSYRFADVAAFDTSGSPVAFYQVGRITQGGLPIAREIYAISDIFEFGGYDVPIHFIPYYP